MSKYKIMPYVYGKKGKQEHCYAVVDCKTSAILAFGSKFFCETCEACFILDDNLSRGTYVN